MTIPPSAPPVLAEEPAELAETILHYIGGKSSDVLAATNAVLSLVAQARQGREHAERLEELCRACSVPRKHHGYSGRTQHWFVAATPSPSPEGGSL